jgi:hypothetical protein
LTFGTTFAHKDFWKVADFGNVKVRVKTGFQYEEINKAFIIGQLAEKLSKDLNYADTIFLDFNHLPCYQEPGNPVSPRESMKVSFVTSQM